VLAGAFFIFTFLAFLGGVVVIVGSHLPKRAQRWAWLPIAVLLAVAVFADEGYNEYRTRQACSREGGMEFGIQFLGSLAKPVWVQSTITTAPQAKAGLLFAYADSGEVDALLTPPNMFADLREYEVNEDGMTSVMRATGLIEKTGRFELFHVSPS